MNLLRKTETYIYADRDLLVHNIEEAVVEVLWHLDGSNCIVPLSSHPVCPITHQVEELGQSGREWGKLWAKDIYASGKVGIGVDPSESPPFRKLAVSNSGLSCVIQSESEGGAGILAAKSYLNSTAGSTFQMLSARGTKATPTVSLEGDRVGGFYAYGYSVAGADFKNAALVAFFIDGEPDTGGDPSDMPGRIVFMTSPDGAAAPLERMRINKAGNFGFNKTTFGTNLEKGMCWGSGVAPTSQPADAVQMWVADFGGGAGLACHHLCTEPGIVIALNQNISTLSSPTFVTAKLTNLNSNYIPYHISDGNGLGNSPFWTDGTLIGLGTVLPEAKLEVQGGLENVGIIGIGVDYGIIGQGGSFGGYFTGKGYFSDNLGIGTDVFGTDLAQGLGMGAGVAPITAPIDMAQVWVEDINAEVGKAGLHMMAESGTGKLIVAGVLIKANTGDPAQVHEGLFCINTFDNNFKVYADAGWRSLATW